MVCFCSLLTLDKIVILNKQSVIFHILFGFLLTDFPTKTNGLFFLRGLFKVFVPPRVTEIHFVGRILNKAPKRTNIQFFCSFSTFVKSFPSKTEQMKHSAVARFVIFDNISSQQNKWFVPRFPTNFIFGPRFPNKTNGLFLQTTFCKPLAKCNKMAK